MDWLQILATVLGNAVWIIPLLLWNRSESRADIRHMDEKLEGQRVMMHAIWKEGKEMNEKWLEESKDFHARLYAIEAPKRK
jgi:hypothetical protein